MALIDVSDILCDPDFADRGIVCERNIQTIGEDGMAHNETKRIKFTGVVTPDTGDLLERLDEGERVKGRITIHSQVPLRDGAEGGSADIVIWKGKRYTVSRISDLTNFGRGFTRASCDVIPFSG